MKPEQSARPASTHNSIRPVANQAAGLSVSTPADYVALFHQGYPDARKVSGEYLLFCHEHADTNPSLSVNLEKDCWICRSCEAKGHISQLPEMRRLLAEQRPNPFARRSSEEARTMIREKFSADAER